MKEILIRVHIGAILVGESKWQRNQELYKELVLQNRDNELLKYITFVSAENDLKVRIDKLCEHYTSSTTSAVTSFFVETIVRYTKIGQCEFIKLHVEDDAGT